MLNKMMRPRLIIGPSASRALVVFGHGLGDTPAGWKDICYGWSKLLPHIKFVLPEAPIQPVSLNCGHAMTSWYDIPAEPLEDRTQTPTKGIEQSAAEWEELVRYEVAQNPDIKVVLGGFSQGGALALYTAARHNVANIAGVLGLSAYLPPIDDLRFPYKTLLCHGTDDPMVKFCNATKTQQLLRAADAQVTLRSYTMEHCVCQHEVDDVAAWLLEVLPPPVERHVCHGNKDGCGQTCRHVQ